MSRKTLLALVVPALLGISLLAWSAPVPPAKEKEAARSQMLSNNPVLVLASDQVNHVLAQPEIRSVGGRSFVIGKAKNSEYTKEPFPGRAVWIPLDKVKEMIELPAE